MANDYSVDDLLDFLSHAGDRGLIPAATAQALAVAVRNVFAVLGDVERQDVRKVDLDGAVKRFTNKRAKDFSPSSLKEYGRRAHKAVELYRKWRENPANFAVKTRSSSIKKRERTQQPVPTSPSPSTEVEQQAVARDPGGYQSAFPVRPGRVITLLNVPEDLTSSEADRLAQFVKMLAVQ